MKQFDIKTLKKLYRPGKNSHKGENGKLLIIGGSELFHGASLWALEVASRIVDMVFYSSVPVNESIVRKQKERFHDGIIVPKNKLFEYLEEADCVLIGPGMERDEKTRKKVNDLLKKYPDKKWVVDGGALQVVEPNLFNERMIITPHHQEYKILFGREKIETAAKKHGCTIVLKGREDFICDSKQCLINQTGNEGMTKGGTGDVLAGLIAALYCKNEAFISAVCASYINKKAGEDLYQKSGYWFNASDLADEIPRVMKKLASFF